MYQALYRKYRPLNFNEVVGQEVIVQTLKNAIITNKISHAYLFTGPRGTGKTSLAKIFSKTVNCNNPINGVSCEKCESCNLINNKQSNDIYEIDAASNNGVDEIRNLKSKINLVPSSSKYKIYIIDEVHMLSTGAFNALLKTLEEPPAHVIFILATTEPQKLPSTILSRCQRYDFKRISNNMIVERLKFICDQEKIEITDDALNEIARISDGGMRDSISILDQTISYKGTAIESSDIHMVNGTLTQNDLTNFMKEIFSGNTENILNMIDQYNNDGKNIIKLTDEIIYYLRNLLIYKLAPNYLHDDTYRNVSELINVDGLYDFIESMNNLKNNMKYSTNIKTSFEIEILRYLATKNSKNISQEIKIDEKKLVKEESKKAEVSAQVPEKVFADGKLVNLRIENTLARFNKKNLLDLRKKKDEIKYYLVDPDNGKYAALLMDGEMKAASDEYVIYVYTSSEDVELFNTHFPEIEKIFTLAMKKAYKLVAVTDEQWEKIKDEFNNKRKKYTYVNEENTPKTGEISISSNTKNVDLFDDIVEYTEEEL